MQQYKNGIPGLLFADTIPTNTTVYVSVPVRDGSIGAFIAWLNATAAATITLELTSHPSGTSLDAGTAAKWKDSAVSITGPAASAEGSEMVNVENVRQRYARLKIVTTALSPIEVWDGGVDRA